MKGRTQFSSLLVLSALGCDIGQAQSTATYSYSGPSQAITYQTGNGATLVNLNVPAELSISSVTTTISVSYPTTGDLNVQLFGPDGTRTILTQKNCGSQGILINMTFADSAAQMYNSFCPASPGTPSSRNHSSAGPARKTGHANLPTPWKDYNPLKIPTACAVRRSSWACDREA